MVFYEVNPHVSVKRNAGTRWNDDRWSASIGFGDVWVQEVNMTVIT